MNTNANYLKNILFFFIAAILLLAGCSGKTTPDEPKGTLNMTVYCPNAGNADAFILRTAHSTVLIDCGEKQFGDDIVDYLDANGISQIDVMFITHFDKDHVGGAAEVIKNNDVKKIYTSYVTKESKHIDNFYTAVDEKDIDCRIADKDFSFTLDGVTYEISVPVSKNYSENDASNNSSIVIRAGDEHTHILFAGDCENERLQELTGSDNLSADIIKIPHHGKCEKLSEAFLMTVNPQYAIITSSEDEPEDKELLAILDRHNIKTYLTRQGSFIIDIKDGQISFNRV